MIADHWGDLASVLGLLVSIVGFWYTVNQVKKSKKAAEGAKDIASRVRDDLIKLESVAEFSTAISIMEEIKRHHREAQWHLLPERYAALRKSLITIKSSNSDLPEDQRTIIQSAISHFSTFEREVEEFNLTNADQPDISSLNEIVSAQIDRLQEILVEIKNKIGR